MTLVYNAERMAIEVIAAALEPPASIDYLAWAEENIVFDDGPFQGPYNRALFPFSTRFCGRYRQMTLAGL